MKLKYCFLLLLYFGLTCCRGVYAEADHDVKRGMHPFMAFIYYSDPSVEDASGQRFVRSAVLIRPDWLLTTAIGPSLIPNGFPKKTLLARAGAITIDSKFTLNEDEDEQEREIVQIVRPYNHSATQWWTTDISLMKTLLPFNITSAVGIKTLNVKQNEVLDAKVCSILVYARKYGNATEDKNLMVLYVELLPSSISNCGSHFTASTMACAADSEENRDALYDPEFCQGNSGGPLICDSEVVGLQTYIGNNCLQPHLYQLLYTWDNFITCGIEDKCGEEQCGAICDVIYKDPPTVEVRVTPPVTQDTARDLVDFLNVPSTTTVKISTPTLNTEALSSVTELISSRRLLAPTESSTEDAKPVNGSEVTSKKEVQLTTPETTVVKTESSTVSTESTLVTETMEVVTKVALKTTHTQQSVKVHSETTHAQTVVEPNDPVFRHWPKEKMSHQIFTEDEEPKRKTNVEAQRAPVATEVPAPKISYSSGGNMCVVQTMLFGFIALLCL